MRTEAGDVYFTLEDRVLRLTPKGTVNTVAGLEADSRLKLPPALALTADGDLLIADSEAGMVFRLHSPGECDRTVRPQIYVSGVQNAAASVASLLTFSGGGSAGGAVILASRVNPQPPLAPGMIASVFGVRLAPGEAAAYDRDAASVPAELAGVTATIDGKQAGIAYASEGQINLVAPFDLPEQDAVNLVLTVDGVPSEPYRVAIGSASPGVLAVVNADGTVNGEEQPAAAGDEVALLVSGLGRPAVEADAFAISDDVIPWPTEEPVLSISPADQNAEDLIVQPLWARSRAGEIASLVEVRFRVPDGAAVLPDEAFGALARLPAGLSEPTILSLGSLAGGFRLYVRRTQP